MTDLDIRPDMRFLATCHGGRGLVRLWDLSADACTDHWWQPGKQNAVLSLSPGGRVGALAISADKRWVVSVGEPGTAAGWDARDG